MIDYEGMIVIHGDLFKLDSSREHLILQAAPEKQFKIADLDRSEYQLMGLYNPKEKMMIAYSSFNGTVDEISAYKAFIIPLPIIERANELSPHVLQDYNQQSLDSKKGYQYVTGDLSERLNGKLPEMKIDGILYLIDLGNLEIRRKDNNDIKFCFNSESIYEATEKCYSTESKTPVEISPRINEYPHHVICFTFPPLRNLDTIGYCQQFGQPLTSTLCAIAWNPKNTNIPWKDLDRTNVPELVRRNQIEQETQGRSSKQEGKDLYQVKTLNKIRKSRKIS
jgi:hypothetical protein